jgi:PAS domain S-box-containing protein
MNYLDIILDNIEDSLVIINPTGEILLFNEEAVRIQRDIGMESLDVGKNLFDIMPESRKSDFRDILDNVIEERKSMRTYVEYPVRKDSSLCMDVNYIPVIGEEGDVRCVNIIGLDITEHKIFQKKIATLAADITNLVENANAVIIGVDSRGYITDWNKHCSIITGYDKNEAYTQKIEKLLIEANEREKFNEVLERVLSKQLINNYEVPVRTKDGRRVIFLLNATPRITSLGQVNGVTFVGQDITELIEYRTALERKVEERTKALQEALRRDHEVVEMRSRFISIASHEFRTPLSSIQFAVNIIRKHKSKLSKEMLADKLDAIERQVIHMNHLLEDVLTHNKGEAGKIQVVLSAVDTIVFFNRIIEEVTQASKGTHQILSEFRDPPATLTTDEKLLRNILINLLTNAIKFSPGKNAVYLTLEKSGDRHIVFSVRDEGLGIDKSDVDKIFQPFLRGSGVSNIQGTGLGLSIVKRSVELLSGEIKVESVLGEGTTFTVKLPINPV